jgi:hypothetical protein
MNALASPNAIESAVAVEPAVESEQECPGRSLNIPFDGERIKSSVALFSSKSIKELEGLTFELHALQDFLRSETERVQHNIESALAGVQIIMDTIAPWRTLRHESGAFEKSSKLGHESRVQRSNVPGSPR